jgi:hypothetical protein
MREATEEAAAGLRNVSLCCGDATVDLGRTIDFSHVYIYDKVKHNLKPELSLGCRRASRLQ